ncbi:MAG: tRNA (adenosine(37)-N6)-threonylcarbamoyltransferase complex dimerization subunit type 1 TsaB [Candidatus Omnitrophica bacterium]|nr:tRNA (adenosine(37)-N6)-threonylcarbamoyltransferase complex dimerization subunit type 1 TsaB [Candidatus Omnitrophota bacterium]
MKTLAFDTSTKFLTVALFDSCAMKASFHKDAGIRHSEILVPTIKDLLEGVKWNVSDIDLIAVGLGPGSFTGLRIGIATVKGLAASLGCKVVGVPTMDAIIQNVPLEKKRIAPLIDARKEKVYTCIYERGNRITDYLLVECDEFLDQLTEEVLFFGDGVIKYKEKLDAHSLAMYDESIDWYPRATNIGLIGIEKSLSGVDSPETIDPLYLHEKECNITHQKKFGR